MPSNRDPPKRRAVWLGAILALVGLAVYRGYSIRHPATQEPKGAAPQPHTSAVPDGGLVRHIPLEPSTRRKMKLAPRRNHADGLAFGKGRLGQVTADGLVVRDVDAYKVTTRLAVEHAKGVYALADGSLLCPGEKTTLRLLPHDEKPRIYPLIPILPGSLVFGDRVDPVRLWALSGNGTTLFGYAIGDKTAEMLLPSEWVPLDGYDRHSVTSLRDGSFMYTTESGFSRFYRAGRKEAIKGNSTEAVRILPGSRPDTVWVAKLDKRVSLHGLLDAKLARLQTVTLEADPFEFDAAGSLLAALELDQPADAPWTFVLEVFDVSGKRKMRESIPAAEALTEDWVERLTENRNLAVSSDPPRVAVGGMTALTVFDASTGKKVFEETHE